MSMKKLGIGSLKQLFKLFFWITFVVVAVFSVFTVAYLYKNINDVKNSTLDSVVYNAQRIIEEHIEDIYASERIITGNRDVQEYVYDSANESLKIRSADIIRETVNLKGDGYGAILFSDKVEQGLIICNAERGEADHINKIYAEYKADKSNDLFMYRIDDSLFPEFYICHFVPMVYHSMKTVDSFNVGTVAVFSKINTYELEKNSANNALLTVRSKNDELGEAHVLIDTARSENYRKGTVLTRKISQTEWYIEAELFKMVGINLFTPFFALTIILLMILIVFVLTFKAAVRRMVDVPITKLSTYLENFELSSRKRTDIVNTIEVDEFDKILRHINKLFERVGQQAHLIIETQQKMYEQELLSKEQTLYMNQMQINPHFLFNTLNTITQMCVANGMEEVTVITQSIADIFRYSIEGDYKTTIDEEVYIVLKYMKIFNSRYGREFCCETEIDDELYEYQILKMTIQPLIENSFKHGGIANKKEPLIKISAYRENDFVIISVYDNGNGIEPEKRDRINADLTESKTNGNKGIGLLNINKRLKAFYGNESGIELKSEVGKYTEVLIRIKEKYNDK